MKIGVHLSEGEAMVTSIGFAEAVIDWWMGYCDDPETAEIQRRGMGEMVQYLEVFCDHHPVYEYKEMICQDTKHGN